MKNFTIKAEIPEKTAKLLVACLGVDKGVHGVAMEVVMGPRPGTWMVMTDTAIVRIEPGLTPIPRATTA